MGQPIVRDLDEDLKPQLDWREQQDGSGVERSLCTDPDQ